jgi:ABC-2 type transport system permease protein
MIILGACIRAEFLKLFRSKVLLLTALAFAAFTLSLNYGGDFFDPAIIYILGSVCFNILAAWMFGVEFVHKTVTELLVFPAHRVTILFAKLIALTVSILILSIGQYVLSCVVFIVTGTDGWAWGAVVNYFVRQGITVSMMLALCMPVFFLGLCSRGYFLPIFVSIAVFLYVNIDDGGLPLAVHIPWRVPLVYAANGELPQPLDAAILIIMGAGGILASLAWWRYADYT